MHRYNFTKMSVLLLRETPVVQAPSQAIATSRVSRGRIYKGYRLKLQSLQKVNILVAHTKGPEIKYGSCEKF